MDKLVDEKIVEKESTQTDEIIRDYEIKRDAILKIGYKQQSFSSLFSWASIIVAVISFGIYTLYFTIGGRSLTNFDSQTEVLDKRLDSLLNLFEPKNNSRKIVIYDTITRNEYLNDIKKVKEDLVKINNVILDNPEKALTIPLLKKELNDLRTNIDKNQDIINSDIARIYDLFKWVGGLIFTLILSLLGLAFSNVFFKKRETTEKVQGLELEELKRLLNDLRRKETVTP
jgi:hypothetical protein